MRNNLEKFLLDKNRNNEMFEDSYSTKYDVYKEKYDDRFEIIYYRRKRDGLKQDSYEVGGYFDSKEQCIYDANFNIRNMFLYDNKMEMKSFSDIGSQIQNEVSEKIKDYMEKNKEKLKKYGESKFSYLNDYEVKRFKDDVNTIYISQKNPELKLNFVVSNYSFRELKVWRNSDVELEYLNNKEKIITDLFKECIEFNKEKIGFEALVYDYKVKYLNELTKSKNPKYNQIKLNRCIYQSINKVYAKNVNINIEYNGNNLNFKYDFDDLKRALSRGETGTSGYGVAYSRISEFIKNNSPGKDNYRNEFEFSHIHHITYGKEEIYNQKDFKLLNKNKERGAR